MSYLKEGHDALFNEMEPPDGWPAVYSDALEMLFASSPTLQTALGKTAEQVRTNHIFNDASWYVESSGVLKAYRPLIVLQEMTFAITRDTFTAARSQGNLHSGTVQILITDNAVNPGDNNPVEHKASKRAFVVFVGRILADIERVALQDVNMGFRSLTMEEAYWRTAPTERSEDHDIWEVLFNMEFGSEE